MGKISSNGVVPANNGGTIDINTLTRQPAQQAQPKSTAEAIVGTIERVLNMPNMQPVIQQGARLISAYADKMILENNDKMQKKSQSPNNSAGHKPIFGAGSDNP